MGVTLAMGADPARRLHLAKNFQPDVDLLLTEGLNAFGQPGSGKSNLVTLLGEQLGRFHIPQLVIDTEGEYRRLINNLPHGVLASVNRCPSGYDILHKGLQVVLDLSTWHTPEAAALSLVQLMDELFTTAGKMMLAGEAVPCAIHLDEAAYWLPQSQVDYFSKDARRALYTVFQRLVNRGRKMGQVPFVYGQFISQINKDVIRRGGVQIFMRQTLDVDLKRYAEYIPDFDDERRESVRTFGAGRAAALLPDGSCPVVTFARCKTEHASATPRAHAALAKFAGTALDLSAVEMRDLAGVEPAPAAPTGKPPVMGQIQQRIRELLVENAEYTPSQLSRRANCSYADAKKWRERILSEAPTVGQQVKMQAEQPTRVALLDRAVPDAYLRALAVLTRQPECSAEDLARLADISPVTARICLEVYANRFHK